MTPHGETLQPYLEIKCSVSMGCMLSVGIHFVWCEGLLFVVQVHHLLCELTCHSYLHCIYERFI